MRIGFSINNISDEPNFLHPVSAWTEIHIEPDDLLLPEEEFIKRFVHPMVQAAKAKFFDMQESAAESS